MRALRRLAGPVVVTAAVGLAAPLPTAPSVPVAQLDDPAGPGAGDADAASFDVGTVFVPLDGVGSETFDGYLYGEPAQDAAFRELLARQGGFVVPSETCGADAVAGLADQATQPVAGRIAATGGTVPVALVVVDVLDAGIGAGAASGAAWLQCLGLAAAEMTVPAPTTVEGAVAVTLLRNDRHTAGVDVVTWSEEGLRITVYASFGLVPEGSLATALGIETSPAEPALEIAAALVRRTLDPVDLLFDEAFATPPGLGYGEPVPGTDAAVRSGLREGWARTALTFGSPPDPSAVVHGAQERLVAGAGGGARLQVVVWDPGFMNRTEFREGWAAGVEAYADAATDFDPGRADVRAWVARSSDGLAEVHWLSECYTAKVVSRDAATSAAVAERAIAAQQAARLAVFGVAGPVTPEEGVDAQEARDERNRALCSGTNLRRFQSGFPVEDTDANGVSDPLDPRGVLGRVTP